MSGVVTVDVLIDLARQSSKEAAADPYISAPDLFASKLVAAVRWIDKYAALRLATALGPEHAQALLEFETFLEKESA